MGGGLLGEARARLLVSGLGALLSLAILATAAAAQGGRASSPIVPPLVRVAAPKPMPPDVVTPVTEATTTSKPKAVAKPARPTSTTTSTTTPLPPPPPALPPAPAIPQGKGMWIWEPPRTEGGSVVTTIAKAKALGLSHLYVRTGSSWDGFQNEQYLDQIVPLAHAAGIKVFGWDFPRLADARMDVFRAQQALNHVEPGNNHIDGFAADIETLDEGTQFTANAVRIYSQYLRDAVGPSTLLIAVVPDPTPQMRQKYNYDATVGPFDAIAPMVYWLNREPGVDTADAMKFLKRYNKPLLPIGQAYDGGPEGGRPGVPSPAELVRFMQVAHDYGAGAVSFWSWQHANAPAFDTIKATPLFVKASAPKS